MFFPPLCCEILVVLEAALPVILKKLCLFEILVLGAKGADNINTGTGRWALQLPSQTQLVILVRLDEGRLILFPTMWANK